MHHHPRPKRFALGDELLMQGVVLIGFLISQCCEQHHFRHVKAVVDHVTLLGVGGQADMEGAELFDGGQAAQPGDQLVAVGRGAGVFEPEKDLMPNHVSGSRSLQQALSTSDLHHRLLQLFKGTHLQLADAFA